MLYRFLICSNHLLRIYASIHSANIVSNFAIENKNITNMNLKLKTFSFALLASASTGMYAQTHTYNNSTNDS